MIEIGHETLIPIREVPRRLPPRPNGKRVHVSACYRWIQRGVRGVRLEAVRIGGSTYTSIEALQRFADQLTNPGRETTLTITSTTATRQRQIDAAEQRVHEALGSGPDRRQQ